MVRHARAADRDPGRFPDDTARPLTKSGAREFARLARRLGRSLEPPQAVLASRWTRAWDTARVLREEAGWPRAERAAALESGDADAVSAIAREISARAGLESLALVGHEPVLSALVGWLLGSDMPVASMRKGAVALLELGSPRQLAVGAATGAARLEALIHPGLLARRD